MASTRNGQVIRFTADNDTYDFGLRSKITILGARLVAAAATSSAQIKTTDTSGSILINMACVANTDTEHSIPIQIDVQVLHVDLSGAGAEVYLYVG